MFQPKPTQILTTLIKARVPVWVLAGAIIAQAAIAAIDKPTEPVCFLKLERLHHSTSVYKKTGKDAIKLNVTSECTDVQRYTQLTAEIYSLRNGSDVNIYSSEPTLQIADKKNHREAYFLNFWVGCSKGTTEMYRGSASGSATLQDGRVIPVSGNTGKYLTVKCESKEQ
mgnify:CR=1 FL=1